MKIWEQKKLKNYTLKTTYDRQINNWKTQFDRKKDKWKMKYDRKRNILKLIWDSQKPKQVKNDIWMKKLSQKIIFTEIKKFDRKKKLKDAIRQSKNNWKMKFDRKSNIWKSIWDSKIQKQLKTIFVKNTFFFTQIKESLHEYIGAICTHMYTCVV